MRNSFGISAWKNAAPGWSCGVCGIITGGPTAVQLMSLGFPFYFEVALEPLWSPRIFAISVADRRNASLAADRPGVGAIG